MAGVDTLYMQAWTGDIAALTQTLQRGCDPNQLFEGDLSLNRAVRERHLTCVDLLLYHGANPNLQSERSRHTALHVAAWRGDAAIILRLLRGNADIAIVNVYQNTPLHEAASAGNVEVIDILVSAGADLRALNWKKMTPLDFARDCGQEAACVALRRHMKKDQRVNRAPHRPKPFSR